MPEQYRGIPPFWMAGGIPSLGGVGRPEVKSHRYSIALKFLTSKFISRKIFHSTKTKSVKNFIKNYNPMEYTPMIHKHITSLAMPK